MTQTGPRGAGKVRKDEAESLQAVLKGPEATWMSHISV